MFYSDLIMQYFTHPLNIGVLDSTQPNIGAALIQSSETARAIALFIQVDAQNGIVKTRFKAQGCPVTIAVAAFCADFLQGKTLKQAEAIKASTIADYLQVPKNKHHCVLMAEQAIKMTLANILKEPL